MENKTEAAKKPKWKIVMIIASMLVITLVCGVAGKFVDLKNGEAIETNIGTGEDTLKGANFRQERDAVTSENSFTEEGTTTMATVTQQAEFSVTTTFMYVEEVYVEAGSTVEEGDAILKIAEDSVTDAKNYYEKRIASAKDYLKEVQLAYEAGELEASYVKLEAESAAESAAATLESSLQEIEESIESKYTKWQEAASKISAYHDNLYNNIYYINAGIEEKTSAASSAKAAAETASSEYEAASTAYTAAAAQFETAMATVNGLVSDTTMETDETSLTEAAANMLSSYEVMKTAEAIYDEKRTANEQATQNLQKATQALEQATLTYQKNEEQAKNNLEQLEGSVDSLKLDYEMAKLEAETKRLTLQKEYETSLLEGEYAQLKYDETVESLQKTVDNAKKSLDTLLEAQEALLSLKNGVVCASQSGTLATVNYEVGDVLISGVAFASYYDTDTILISVEIEQENIAKVAVGDEVQVAVSGNRRGNITGTVASIASSATSGRSVSDVTYAVVITVDNVNHSLSSGQSATITFEYGE